MSAMYLMVSAVLVVTVVGQYDTSHDFAGPWVRAHNPCSMFRCPTNNVCYKTRVSTLTTSGLFGSPLMRAMCHPIEAGLCSSNPCPGGLLCQTTEHVCADVKATDDNQALLDTCQYKYVCISPEQWYGEKMPVQRQKA